MLLDSPPAALFPSLTFCRLAFGFASIAPGSWAKVAKVNAEMIASPR